MRQILIINDNLIYNYYKFLFILKFNTRSRNHLNSKSNLYYEFILIFIIISKFFSN